MSLPELYPAIDVREGRVVRLRQGDYAQETHYGDDPFAVARRYADEGARWLHLVDLDAARSGGYTLQPLLERIVAGTGLRVQTGGGVRSRADVDALLSSGAERVVVGSLAVREPDRVTGWLHGVGPDRLVLALDTRRDDAGRWRLPVHGWTQSDGDADLDTLALHYADAGLRHLLCTDIGRDGTMAGPNLDLYESLCERLPDVDVQASGGVRGAVDIAAAATAGCRGVILGRVLLDGRARLPELLREAD